jgi:hypothetical protein
MSAATGVILLGLWIQIVSQEDRLPPVALTDLHWFPPYVVVADNHRMAGDRAWHLNVERMYGDDDMEAYCDAKARAEVWWILKEAAQAPGPNENSHMWDAWRLRYLELLREQIGVVAYYRGEMPDAVRRGTK